MSAGTDGMFTVECMCSWAFSHQYMIVEREFLCLAMKVMLVGSCSASSCEAEKLGFVVLVAFVCETLQCQVAKH